MESPVFEVSLHGSNGILLPGSVVTPFLETGQKRVEVYAFSRHRTPQKRVEKALQVGQRLVEGIRKPRDLFKSR